MNPKAHRQGGTRRPQHADRELAFHSGRGMITGYERCFFAGLRCWGTTSFRFFAFTVR